MTAFIVAYMHMLVDMDMIVFMGVVMIDVHMRISFSSAVVMIVYIIIIYESEKKRRQAPLMYA